jgi:tocopherol O-methyltransferase
LTTRDYATDVGRYYDEKTDRILAKYGPGPRVHYHTGISDGRIGAAQTLAELSVAMSKAQELVLDLLAQRTRPSLPTCRVPLVLDVGCGLGGGSIYLAQKLGAEITGITIVPDHLRVARGLAERARVADRVEFLEMDAHLMPGEEAFDAAWAIESSCYMDRRAWLARIAGLLRPGAELHIFDWMRGEGAAAVTAIDDHWKTRMGPPSEYKQGAQAAGLSVVHERVLNGETAGFWVLARQWDLLALEEPNLAPWEIARLKRSAEAISALESAFRAGNILSVHMSLRKPGRSEA